MFFPTKVSEKQSPVLQGTEIQLGQALGHTRLMPHRPGAIRGPEHQDSCGEGKGHGESNRDTLSHGNSYDMNVSLKV